MIRQIIKINEDRCIGCGLCVKACHEGAIGMVNGKAKLLREDYCDGLGNCLPVCPTAAISFEHREAEEFNEEEANKNKPEDLPCGCPGTNTKTFERKSPQQACEIPSRLNQWPVQIKLVPVNAQYFNGAHLLISADCAAYAYGDFHNGFIKNRITLIGCPKLDEGEYSEKLTAILRSNDIKSVTIVRMEVPCCGGIEYAVKTALQNCGKMIPWQVYTISTSGEIFE